MSDFGSVDILMHCAWIWPPQEVWVDEMSDERWHRPVRDNVDGMFCVSRAASLCAPGARHVVGEILHLVARSVLSG